MKNFTKSLLTWYSVHQRPLPWREHPTPYHVLVSEIMLQQTPVARVMEKFFPFLQQFPTLKVLANAPQAKVIKAWSGMGYNRRALLLQRLAQEVMEKHQGKIPEQPAILQTLPGIGPYTAGALAAFAFNKPEPAVDVNVRRIYSRYFNGKDQGRPMGRREEEKLRSVVLKIIPPEKSRDFHNALMDFGSLVCTREAPNCVQCPFQANCKFYPLYQKRGKKALFHPERRQEPGIYEHGKCIPNRIFRGRIVEWVRKNEKKDVSLLKLGKAIKEDFIVSEKKWLSMLCARLKKEGLIQYSYNQNKFHFTLE